MCYHFADEKDLDSDLKNWTDCWSPSFHVNPEQIMPSLFCHAQVYGERKVS